MLSVGLIILLVQVFVSSEVEKWSSTLAVELAYQVCGFTDFFYFFDGDKSNDSSVYNGILGFLILSLFVSIIDFFTNGRSLGNYIFGLKVTQLKKTSRLSFFVSFFRNRLRIIPLSLFSYLGARPRGFHNLICQTKVVDLTYYEEGQSSFFGKEISSFFRHLIFLTKRFFSRSKITNSDLKKLNEIFDLKEKGALSQEEYEKFKDEILKK